MDRLALPLKRSFAEQIVAGTKNVEFRDFSAHYQSRIYDKAVMDWIDAHGEDKSIPDEEFFCADPVRQVRSIHFYDYNGTWSLDVAVKETGIIALNEKGISYLNEAFNCHEMDYAIPELEAAGIPADQRPLMFYFAIERIIFSNL